MGILNWLKGKKTYLIALAAIIGAIAAYANGDMTLLQMAEAIFIACGGASLRAGIAKIGQ